MKKKHKETAEAAMLKEIYYNQATDVYGYKRELIDYEDVEVLSHYASEATYYKKPILKYCEPLNKLLVLHEVAFTINTFKFLESYLDIKRTKMLHSVLDALDEVLEKEGDEYIVTNFLHYITENKIAKAASFINEYKKLDEEDKEYVFTDFTHDNTCNYDTPYHPPFHYYVDNSIINYEEDVYIALKIHTGVDLRSGYSDWLVIKAPVAILFPEIQVGVFDDIVYTNNTIMPKTKVDYNYYIPNDLVKGLTAEERDIVTEKWEKDQYERIDIDLVDSGKFENNITEIDGELIDIRTGEKITYITCY